MNANYRRVSTRFGPDTGFEVRPLPTGASRAWQEAELERLRTRLLAEWLGTRWASRSDDPLRRAANEAAALAWVTRYPLLVFPALFEEKAEAALLQAGRQEQVRQRSRELLTV
jgi:hypothetical protein